MASPRYYLIIILAVSAASVSRAVRAQTDDETTWAKRVETGTEVVTTLQFYFHDILVSGQNDVQSAVRIAEASDQTNNSATFFGMLMMVDNRLTITPDPKSKIIGRARGMYGSAGQTEFGLIMVLNYGFSDGIYDGSSFNLVSLNPVMQPVREMSIEGGTRLFRLARGYALASTYKFDALTGNAVVGYNVTIVNYV